MISGSSFPDRELLNLARHLQNAEQCAQGSAVADSLAQAADGW